MAATVLMCFLTLVVFVCLFYRVPDDIYVENKSGALFRLNNISFHGSDVIYELQNIHTGEIKRVTLSYLNVHFKRQRH